MILRAWLGLGCDHTVPWDFTLCAMLVCIASIVFIYFQDWWSGLKVLIIRKRETPISVFCETGLCFLWKEKAQWFCSVLLQTFLAVVCQISPALEGSQLKAKLRFLSTLKMLLSFTVYWCGVLEVGVSWTVHPPVSFCHVLRYSYFNCKVLNEKSPVSYTRVQFRKALLANKLSY